MLCHTSVRSLFGLFSCFCEDEHWGCLCVTAMELAEDDLRLSKRDKPQIHVINWVLQNTEKEANLPLSTDVRTLKELIASGQEALLLTVWPGSVPGPRWRSAPDSCYRLALAMSLHCFGPLKHPYNSSTVLNYSIHRHARTRSLVVVHTWRHP